MSYILNSISVIATLIAVEAFIYIILDVSFGRIKILNITLFAGTKIKHILFLGFGLALVLPFAEFHRPW